jgi:hypothetical protein
MCRRGIFWEKINVSVEFPGGIWRWFRDLLCDIPALGHCHAVIDERREFPKPTGLFSELRRCQTTNAWGELDLIVETLFMELPCCADTA